MLMQIIEEQAENIETLVSTNKLCKVNHDLRNDILQLCKERDKAYRIIEQQKKEINKLMGG